MKNNARFFYRLFFTCLVLSFAANAQTIDKSISKLCESIVVVDFSGEASDEVFPGDNWQFFGPTRQITVTEKQKIIGSGSAVFGTTSGTSRIAVSLCYLKKGSDMIAPLAENNHLIADADSVRRTFALSASAQLAAGTYSVGYCVNNRGPQALNNNNYVNGWIIVIN
jgi:hypothetical protein